jgi:hypothetical protein
MFYLMTLFISPSISINYKYVQVILSYKLVEMLHMVTLSIKCTNTFLLLHAILSYVITPHSKQNREGLF